MKGAVIFLNGPPGCGKDYAGHELFPAICVKFAGILKERTHALYDLRNALTGKPYAHSHYEDVKDEPTDDFLGLTPREAYIAVSETYMKPTHGIDVFGKLLLASLTSNPFMSESPVFAITDSGFREEAEVIVEHFGAENCYLIRIHAKGLDFSGDSRGYIDLSDLDVKTTDVSNGFDIQFGPLVVDLVDNFLSQRNPQ